MPLKKTFLLKILLIGFLIVAALPAAAQFYSKMVWSADSKSYFQAENAGIVEYKMPTGVKNILVSSRDLTPEGNANPLDIRYFLFSSDYRKILIYTNSKKVWRYETRGDYWVYDLNDLSLRQLGASLPTSSLMFAKFSPDGGKAAYVSGHNLYVEDLKSHRIKSLTKDGSRKMINGTFDWVYEEEFDCRDGFRWSPDSRAVAFWQINDSSTRDYLMLNTTDSVYSHVIPVEYPVAGQLPSPYKIGVVDIGDGSIRWMHIPTDKKLGGYLPRMEWAANSGELIVQHLNRQQNESKLMICDVKNGLVKTIFSEKDSAWIDIISRFDNDYRMGGWDWLQNGQEFLWPSEKDGWRHLYRISRDGKKQTLVTVGDYDVMGISLIDEKENLIYFLASPYNATQQYLYRCPLDGKGRAERVTPAGQTGTNDYELSPDGHYAVHRFSNYYTTPSAELISLPEHQKLPGVSGIRMPLAADSAASGISFFQVKTAEGVIMDGWMQKPDTF